jgi:hypothetical protein
MIAPHKPPFGLRRYPPERQASPVGLAATLIRERAHWARFDPRNFESAAETVCALAEHLDLMAFELQDQFTTGRVMDEPEPFSTKAREIVAAIKAKREADDKSERDEPADRSDWRYHQRAGR